MPHATLTKFGYPETLLTEREHWALLVRPAQVTLGSLVLCAKSDQTAYGDLPVEAFAQQHEMIGLGERLLTRLVRYERINYLMLMMVDPHVHFHIIPRYEGSREFGGLSFPDTGWPGPPKLTDAQPAPTGLIEQLRQLVGEIEGHGGRDRD